MTDASDDNNGNGNGNENATSIFPPLPELKLPDIQKFSSTSDSDTNGNGSSGNGGGEGDGGAIIRKEEGSDGTREIYGKMVFPAHIPPQCHPNVSSMAELIHDLNTAGASTSAGATGASAAEVSETNQVKDKGKAKAKDAFITREELERLNQSNEERIKQHDNITTTPLQQIQKANEECNIFLRMSQRFRKEFLEEKRKAEENANASDIEKGRNAFVQVKLLALSKVQKANYNYCLSMINCPQRVHALNQCYLQFHPEYVKELAEEDGGGGMGGLSFICPNERKAVERCCGQNVEAVHREILQKK